MAPSSFSLLLRHFSVTNHHFRRRNTAVLLLRHLSLSSSPPSEPPNPNPTSLSARLSFVFDKIDEIEKDRAESDVALRRIRAWRQSKNLSQPPPNSGGHAAVVDGDQKLGLGFSGGDFDGGEMAGNVVEAEKRVIEVAHPWPEWVELMERLVKQNYFDHRRVDEDRMVEGLGEVDDNADVVKKFEEGNEQGGDFTRDWRTVQMAMVNFGKDRFDIFRSLSRQDIQLLVGYGCPSADKKVVFSSKLLRKHAHLDEGDVCSSCSLRNTCERAYLVTNKEDEARTIDLMRVLLAYGFDPINGSVENKSLMKQKSVKTAVRMLLREVVRLSAVPIDPNLPPPLIKKRPPKVKQPPPPPKRRVGRDDIEMKKGDWLCQKCNFLNFAKNPICLQCDAKRPKRQLLPGEWECPQCDFLNYRRNMTCFNCEHKRPPDGYTDDQAQGRQNRPHARLDRVPDREQVSNAWNFDFDDDESDGADVAAFEYADPHAMNEDRRLDSPPDGNVGRPQEDYRVGRTSRFHGKEYSRPAEVKDATGFDDFDDEDDDIDNYELDNQNRNERREAPAVNFSDVENEGYSESGSDDDLVRFSGRGSSSYPKSSKPLHHKGASSDTGDDDLDYGSDEDLPVHPKWKSSHVADSGLRDRASRGSFKQKSFVDDDDDDDDDDDRLVFGNDNYHDKGFAHKQGRGNFRNSDEGFRGSDDDDRRGFGVGNHRNKSFAHKQGRGNSRDFDRRESKEMDGQNDGYVSRQGRGNFRDSDEGGFSRGNELNRNRGRGGYGGRQDVRSVNKNDFGRPSRGSDRSERGSFERGRGRGRGRGSDRNQRGSYDDEQGHQRMTGRHAGTQKFDRPGQRGAGNRRNTNDWSDSDNDRPLRQRRNVR
ncbi:hypothetical protein RND81_09G227000 [Saponaria officinalis]|uniref:RanBP2-type domain-containing protein n=1 Tax=Saponaria officinalis TaxID=3572 RepID=A0AAW1IPE3_SAPOF